MVVVLFLVAGFVLGYWYRWRRTISWALREVQASCRHYWGETFEVEPRPTAASWYRQRFWKQSCVLCAAQRDVNEDGSVYVPLRDRKDDEQTRESPH